MKKLTKVVSIFFLFSFFLQMVSVPSAKAALSIDDYKAWFTGGGKFELDIQSNDNTSASPPTASAPTIHVAGANSLGRPGLTFKLKHVIRPLGTLRCNNVLAYFVVSEINGSAKDKSGNPVESNQIVGDFAVKINYQGTADFIRPNDLDNPEDDEGVYGSGGDNCDFAQPQEVTVKQDNYFKNFVNKVYNGAENSGSNVCGSVTTFPNTANPVYSKSGGGSTVELSREHTQCVNVSATGWLAKWGIGFNQSSALFAEGTCGLFSKSPYVDAAFCGLAQIILEAAVSFKDFVMGLIKDSDIM